MKNFGKGELCATYLFAFEDIVLPLSSRITRVFFREFIL